MIFFLKRSTFILLVFFLLSTFVHWSAVAQTDSLNIYWDRNSDSDMLHYKLLRSINGSSFELIETISHPDTHAVDRDSQAIQPGNLIEYTLIAVDSVFLESDTSQADSAGIPKITWTASNIAHGQTTNFNLYPAIIADPDHESTELQIDTLNVENSSEITFINDRTIIGIQPLVSSGTVSFGLKVEDPEGFWDQKLILMTITTQLPEFNETIQISWEPSDAQLHVEITTQQQSRAKMDYWITPGLINSVYSKDYTLTHSFDVVNLLIDTTYVFSLSLEDINGVAVTVLDSTFRTSSLTSTSSGNVIVFPNPFRPEQGHSVVVFEPIPVEARELLIFTPTGDLVYNQKLDEFQLRRVEWEVTNNAKKDLASGFYIYIIMGEGNKKLESGKLAVIR
jgi:hypothetical protein